MRSLRAKEQQQSHTESVPGTAEEGMVVYLHQERQDAVALEVPADADTAHLAVAAVASGVDMRLKKLMHQGKRLGDGSESLADAGVCAESYVELAWDISALMTARPIFKTVFKADGAGERDEGTVVLLQWPPRSTGLARPTFSGEQPMLVPFEMMVNNSGESDEFVPFELDLVKHRRRFPEMAALFEEFQRHGLSALLGYIDLDFKQFVDDSGRMHTFPFFVPLRSFDFGMPRQFTVTFTGILKY